MLWSVRIVGCSFLTLTFLVGLLGNAIVCSVIHTNWHKTSATNIILLNLAIADILGCLVNMPIMFITFIVDFDDTFLENLSDAHFVLTIVIGLAICLCHWLLCLDRYDAIACPFHRRITKPRMKKISAGTWAISIGIGVIASALVIVVPTHWLILHDDQPHYIAGEVLNGVGTVVILLTLAVMLYSFFKVKKGIKMHDRTTSSSLRKHALEKEMQLTKVAAVMITGFTVTCLPWVFVRLLHSITGHQQVESYVISYCLLYMSHAVNPIVYAGLMRKFQKAMKTTAANAFRRMTCREVGEEVSDMGPGSRELHVIARTFNTQGRRRSCAAIHPLQESLSESLEKKSDAAQAVADVFTTSNQQEIEKN